MSVVSVTVCDLPMQIVSDRDRRRRRLFQIIWKPGLTKRIRLTDCLSETKVVSHDSQI